MLAPWWMMVNNLATKWRSHLLRHLKLLWTFQFMLRIISFNIKQSHENKVWPLQQQCSVTVQKRWILEAVRQIHTLINLESDIKFRNVWKLNIFDLVVKDGKFWSCSRILIFYLPLHEYYKNWVQKVLSKFCNPDFYT